LLGWGRTRRPHAFEQLVDRCLVRHRIFAGFGFSTASRSIISRPRRHARALMECADRHMKIVATNEAELVIPFGN
jgi:hypothetical protein